MKNIIQKFEGVVYKRGQVVIIDGIECKYSKMVKGKQVFKKVESSGKDS